MKNSDLPINKSNRISDFDILEAFGRTVGDKIQCIQLDRDLWRIYLMDNDSKRKLMLEGFELNGQTVSVFEFNPYSSGASSPQERVLKVTVSGIPLSVDDKEIMQMLEKFDISPTSTMKYENIRHPVTKKMTSVLNGNRFIYIKPLPEGKFLPRVSYCAGLRCNIHHWGQPKYKRKLLCKICWG